jgi:hypothetical protein
MCISLAGEDLWAKPFVRQRIRPVQPHFQTGKRHTQEICVLCATKAPTELIHARAAALNNDHQHDNKKHA